MIVVFFKRLVILISVIAIIVLTIYTYFYTPKTYSVYDFVNRDTDHYLEKTISLYGTIRNPEIRNNHLFFNICSGATCVGCVIFNYKDFQKEIIFNNTTIKVTGKYTIFNNNHEIIVHWLDHVNI